LFVWKTILKSTKQRLRVAVFLATLLALPAARADSYPLWEVGAGLAGLNVPNYRGSDVRQTYVLPIPYLIYRGEVLRADRDGLRGLLFDSERLEINVSLNATLPVNSDDDPVRQGMADLDPAVELGPTVNLHLWRSTDRKTRLDVRLPVRTAITIASRPEQIGWLFSPNLLLAIRDPAGQIGWNLGLQAGPYFNDREYNATFYAVSPADATAQRPAYAASGGYSGSQFTLILTKRFPRYWVGGFLRYDTLAGSVIEDSPLVRRSDAVSVGLALSWVFKESRKRVEAEE
jgi:outer membrane scaffolding protein for murein synthesis (MipA/OmpV family)